MNRTGWVAFEVSSANEDNQPIYAYLSSKCTSLHLYYLQRSLMLFTGNESRHQCVSKLISDLLDYNISNENIRKISVSSQESPATLEILFSIAIIDEWIISKKTIRLDFFMNYSNSYTRNNNFLNLFFINLFSIH